MNLLILTMDYPRLDGTHARMYVHVRDCYYAKKGLDVTVLNFSAKEDYVINSINVITLKTFAEQNKKYDIAVSHASNVRNHYRFLKKYENMFKKIVFFFHGHEIIYLNKEYPKPYKFNKKSNFVMRFAQGAYDSFKIKLWSSYLKKLIYKAEFVFVSDYIFNMFKNNLKITENDLKGHFHIINNSIGEIFEKASYDYSAEKEYDFITIRSNLDASTYCIDLVTKLARMNEDKKFLLIGRGDFYKHVEKPDNLTLINKTISHKEMIEYLNKSRCAVNLTRQDTQGVMTCELIAFGIPVITSDIQVCKEFFEKKKNAELINNEKLGDISKISDELFENCPYEKDTEFFAENTIEKEIELYKKII